MCGRYASLLPPDAIRAVFATVNPPPNAAPNWNLAPMQPAPVVRRHPQTGARHLDLLQWGLVPHFITDPKGGRKPINARAETLASSAMFRDAFARRRCLVPASAFYEWQQGADGKQPWAMARADGQALALAGIWEGWRAPDGQALRSFAIVTTAANALMRPLHDRMPVIVEPADWPLWLGEIPADPAPLLRPADEAVLRMWPVSRAVNNVRNNGPDLLAPLADAARIDPA